jgi:hypothetical protein
MGIKLPAAYETEIYVSDGDYVAIKQANGVGDEDVVVILTADQLPHVIQELQTLWEKRVEWSKPVQITDPEG